MVGFNVLLITTASLVDPGVCIGSDYTILADPTTEGGLYTVAYTFDTAGKETLLQLARQEGDPANYCSSCTGGGTVQFGFRAEVTGIILDERSPPTLQVLAALPSNGREEQACLVPTEPPSMAPILQVPTSDSAVEPGPVDVPAPAPSGTSAPVILIGAPTTDAPVISDGTSGMTDAPVISAAVPRTDAPVIAAGAPSTSAPAISTGEPTAFQTENPVLFRPVPGSLPTVSNGVPSSEPTVVPSTLYSDVPTDLPSDDPSDAPSDQPSDVPSDVPSAASTPTPTRVNNLPVTVPTPVILPLQDDSASEISSAGSKSKRVIRTIGAVLVAFFATCS